MKITDVITQGKSKGMITEGFEEDWGFGDGIKDWVGSGSGDIKSDDWPGV